MSEARPSSILFNIFNRQPILVKDVTTEPDSITVELPKEIDAEEYKRLERLEAIRVVHNFIFSRITFAKGCSIVYEINWSHINRDNLYFSVSVGIYSQCTNLLRGAICWRTTCSSQITIVACTGSNECYVMFPRLQYYDTSTMSEKLHHGDYFRDDVYTGNTNDDLGVNNYCYNRGNWDAQIIEICLWGKFPYVQFVSIFFYFS